MTYFLLKEEWAGSFISRHIAKYHCKHTNAYIVFLFLFNIIVCGEGGLVLIEYE